ncbi:MAG: DUF3147 family protein, partial [Terriglobales bacterium]
MKEIILRALVGGLAVSAFALLGDLLKPKSFAGLVGAAPSVALATILLTVGSEGKEYVSLEARSMALGALAFFLYASVVSRLLIRWKLAVLPVTSLSILIWFGGALG